MARQVQPKYTALGAFPTLPITAGAATLTLTAADVANKEQVVATGKDMILAYNSGASPYTVTITSVASPTNNRSGDITTYSVAAGSLAVFGPFGRDGWVQSDGAIYFEASNASVKFAVISFPQ